MKTKTKQKRTANAATQRMAETIARQCTLFHTADGVSYASFAVKKHRETLAVRSRLFSSWVRRIFWERMGRAATNHFVQGLVDLLDAQARFTTGERPVFTRIGHVGRDRLYIDLCDDQWRVVEVTKSGWSVLRDSPVAFRRAHGMLPLPLPERDGDVQVLWHYLNLADARDRRLALGWLLGAFMPSGPYPILLLQGEHGTAKSTNARVLRSLVDPNVSELRGQPRSEHDLMIAAQNSWLIAYDNLSGIRRDLADALCRVSTGGGFGARKLFTDDEEQIFRVSRPVLLTGIDALATREDLADRCVLLNLPIIPDGKRRNETDFWNEFHGAAGVILGGILDVLVAILANRDGVNLDALSRMADFEMWVTAGEEALGWKAGAFSRAFAGMRKTMMVDSAENDTLVNLLERLLVENGLDEWKGTPTALLDELNAIATEREKREPFWPTNARWLTDQLNRRAASIRAVGKRFESRRSNGSRRILIARDS